MFYARMLGGLIDNLWTTNGIYQIADSFSATNPTQLAVGPVFPERSARGAHRSGASAPRRSSSPRPISRRRTRSRRNLTVSARTGEGHGVERFRHLEPRRQPVGRYGPERRLRPPITPTPSKTPTANRPATSRRRIYTTPRPNTKYGAVYEVTNGINSYYDALAVTLKSAFRTASSRSLSYTWSHEIDEGQGGGSSAIFFSRSVPTRTTATTASSAAAELSISGTALSTLSSGRRRSPSGQRVPEVCRRRLAAFGHHDAGCGKAHRQPDDSRRVRAHAGFGQHPFHQHHRWIQRRQHARSLPAGEQPLYTCLLSRRSPHHQGDSARHGKSEGCLIFEAFNVSNTWSPTSLFSQAYTATKGVLQATPTAFGYGSADGGFPDGTQARRMQISARVTF